MIKKDLTFMPLSIETCAIPAPIKPAPNIPIVLTNKNKTHVHPVWKC